MPQILSAVAKTHPQAQILPLTDAPFAHGYHGVNSVSLAQQHWDFSPDSLYHAVYAALNLPTTGAYQQPPFPNETFSVLSLWVGTPPSAGTTELSECKPGRTQLNPESSSKDRHLMPLSMKIHLVSMHHRHQIT